MKPALLVPDPTVPVPATVPPPWPGRQVTLSDGTALHVRETPPTADHTEPALYVHGLGGSAQNWTDLAGLLAGRLDGMAVDLPGFGRSGPPVRGGYGQAAFARTLTRLLDETGRGPVHLFGNSLGGALAVRVAATRPDLVRTLTLVSPAMPVLRPREAHRQMLPVLVVPRVERIVDRVMRDFDAEQMAKMMVAMCYGDPSRVPPERFGEAVEEATARLADPWASRAYVRSLRGLVYSYLRPAGWSLWRLAARVTAPTLVTWGDRDRLVDVRLAGRTAETIPDSRLATFSGVGHTAQMEVPRLLARAVWGLLDEVPGRLVGAVAEEAR